MSSSDRAEPTQMRKALFMHTQKTAGTSVQVMARWTYGNDSVISHADYQKLGLEGCRTVPFVSGHFGIEFAKSLMIDRYCFTFLRDPIERILSLYSFCSTQPKADSPLNAAAQEYDLGQFLALADREPFRHHLWNHQVWQLAYGRDAALAGAKNLSIDDFRPQELLDMAVSNLKLFDRIGKVDTFSEDITRIFMELGCRHPVVQKYNVSAERYMLEELPAAVQAQLIGLTELDRNIYGQFAS
jgi:hypothetical protein